MTGESENTETHLQHPFFRGA